jgi:hypothetical protein
MSVIIDSFAGQTSIYNFQVLVLDYFNQPVNFRFQFAGAGVFNVEYRRYRVLYLQKSCFRYFILAYRVITETGNFLFRYRALNETSYFRLSSPLRNT